MVQFLLTRDTVSLEHTVIPIRAQFLYPSTVNIQEPPALPTRITLEQNYPNPFSTSTTIEYALSRPGHVRLDVHDILGRRVVTIVDEHRAAGTHNVPLETSGWASGIYVYRLQTGDRIITRKMVLVK